MDPGYYQRRYKEDAAYRASVVAATQRWQDRQRAADPEAWAERVARGSAQRRERYQIDPEFRERLLEAQRRRRRAAKGPAAPPPPADPERPPGGETDEVDGNL